MKPFEAVNPTHCCFQLHPNFLLRPAALQFYSSWTHYCHHFSPRPHSAHSFLHHHPSLNALPFSRGIFLSLQFYLGTVNYNNVNDKLSSIQWSNATPTAVLGSLHRYQGGGPFPPPEQTPEGERTHWPLLFSCSGFFIVHIWESSFYICFFPFDCISLSVIPSSSVWVAMISFFMLLLGGA